MVCLSAGRLPACTATAKDWPPAHMPTSPSSSDLGPVGPVTMFRLQSWFKIPNRRRRGVNWNVLWGDLLAEKLAVGNIPSVTKAVGNMMHSRMILLPSRASLR